MRGGYNVYPVEVEAVPSTHPDVDAASGANPTLEDLRAFATDRLARYRLPEAVVFTDALPLTACDKIDRRALAARVVDQSLIDNHQGGT